MKVVREGLVVDLADAALLRAHARGEVAEVVDGQRQVGGHGLADRLAVVPGLGGGQHGQVFLHAVGDAVQDVGALGGRGAAPGALGLVGGVERALDVGGAGARHFAEDLAGDGRDVAEILVLHRRDPFAADVVAVALLERHRGTEFARFEHVHGLSPLGKV
ncbi:hypothetical protein FQZ97_679320 [compost metagenome]